MPTTNSEQSAHTAASATWVYVSNADSQDISVLELDRNAGTLKPVATVPVGGTAMPMAVSKDKKFLHVAVRSQPFRVVTFAIDGAAGGLKKLGESALADSMCNIDLDPSGKWLFAASYGGNKITVNSITAEGVVGPVHQLLHTAPNAHAIHADASGRYVFATSLGGDNLSSWKFDAEKGLLSPNAPALVNVAPAKTGPRHFTWDKAQKFMYLLNELDGGVDVFAYDNAKGSLHHLQRSTVVPPAFDGKVWAADLQISPDGSYLYGSERTSSTLTTFKVDAATGQIQVVGHTPTEKVPRSFAVDSSGRFLIACGQESHSVSLHPIDAATGLPGAPSRLPVGQNPNWVEIVDF
ncbi:MAG TPA: beta-propeller fold lactonase family protein [Polaromonas sp.]|uniref:lactonase family protein n=1 Tax=Polaromonas sp. TaxID=1869339 RepID=UPI002D33F54D|nr:beta-propeller fold lactonase family protein [Polaromonas sp.]HYW58361.1 beta-propeller fold lactonase family protein [Polaromonas sp.]